MQQKGQKLMKLKTSTGIYEIVDANHKDGALYIVFDNDSSCEELQSLFADKDSIARIEILTDDDVLASVITGYVVLERVELQGNEKTVILGKEIDDTEMRITQVSAGLVANAEQTTTNADNIEKQRADIDYMAMNMGVALDE